MSGESLSVSGQNNSIAADWSSAKQAFHVPWGKLMMWIFLISDTFIFSCFLIGYMNVRRTTTDPWPYPSGVFALELFGNNIPLILIAIMTFILITSSGTMALAVRYAHFRDKKKIFWLMVVTALFGLSFVGMQAFEWTKLIGEGVRPWGNPFGAPQFGSIFFMVTGFHGLHVSCGVIYLLTIAFKIKNGDYDKKNDYSIVEITGLYWHFVDLVWVFIFAFFYLW
jgi:cytochrome c oxidase subunit 3